MKLDNGILSLELTNIGGEMASLTYKGMDILYKGDGEHWKGKNPTLFPFISSPKDKKYTLDGITYPCRNHGLIRYSTLSTTIDDGNIVSMRLISNEDTLKEYPFKFEYNITYKLDGNKVLINYDITNKDTKDMPFTFGLHPGFIVRDFNETSLVFDEDDMGKAIDNSTRNVDDIKLGNYTNFLNDLAKYKTVILKDLKSKYVDLKTKEYTVRVDMSKFKYLGLWTADPNAKFMCIEPWLSINPIENSKSPFEEGFELETLKPNETFKIDYYIEVK